MWEFEELMILPGTEQERDWLAERLSTLSKKEKHIVSAIVISARPESMAEAINQLLSMEDYGVCFPAGSYAQLGSFYLRHEAHLPERTMYYADLERIGMMYEDRHPGLFIGSCYVAYPSGPVPLRYTGQGLIPVDDGWSVKVKLASPTIPEGVWLRLPDHSAVSGQPDEVALALDELNVRSLEDCVLMDARCGRPQLGDLMEQYADALELVNDGSDLGYALEEQGQGTPRFLERFAAALEFENCHDLRFALDIIQNLHCYEWIPCDSLKEFGRRKLLEAGVAEELLSSGCIDLEGYAADLLEEAGYVLTAAESAYITRNSREFIYERSAPEEAGMTMEQQ